MSNINKCPKCDEDALRQENADLRGMLKECREAIKSLDADALGRAGMYHYPIRDELVSDIGRALGDNHE